MLLLQTLLVRVRVNVQLLLHFYFKKRTENPKSKSKVAAYRLHPLTTNLRPAEQEVGVFPGQEMAKGSLHLKQVFPSNER